MTDVIHPLDERARALDAMSIRELIAELALLQERIDRDAAAGGYRPVPGQVHRRAELERRERQVVRELDRRHAANHEHLTPG
jgi:hypothetical protein